jgi:hypothetical protein
VLGVGGRDLRPDSRFAAGSCSAYSYKPAVVGIGHQDSGHADRLLERHTVRAELLDFVPRQIGELSAVANSFVIFAISLLTTWRAALYAGSWVLPTAP